MPLSCVSRGIPRLHLRNHLHLHLYANPVRPFTTHPASLPDLPLFRALADHDPSSTAVVHASSAHRFRYGHLVNDVLASRAALQGARDVGNAIATATEGRRVAFLVENSYAYVVTLLSILAGDAIAVPLSPAFPVAELRYIIENSGASVLLASERFSEKGKEVLHGIEGVRFDVIGSEFDSGLGSGTAATAATAGGAAAALENVNDIRGGMMLYTSGTTSRPKGVLLPQSALTAQATALIEAWKYSPQDYLLHLLPLHHIHGTVNAILTPVLAGSAIEFLFPFNPDVVWRRLAAPFTATSSSNTDKITFLTAVPTIYTKLLSSFPGLPRETQTAAKQAISPHNLRLNISGSAALPTPTKQAWQDLSDGNVLLERYGMTEVGMAISCGLDFADRVDGSVGWALPGVEARLVDESGDVIPDVPEGESASGEIQLRGPAVFSEYWGNPKATAEAFVADTDVDSDTRGKWFGTGDVASRRVVDTAGHSTSGPWATGPMYFIHGRQSVDIIKTGGEKVSALEVERELLSLPQISETAVVPLPSRNWGQKVAAVIVLRPDLQHSGTGKPFGKMDVRRALRGRLAAYKIPVVIRVLDAIPRNAMGKVNKKALVKEVFG